MTKVRVNERVCKAFNVRVGVAQSSVLSLLIIVLEAFSREFREGLPIELAVCE